MECGVCHEAASPISVVTSLCCFCQSNFSTDCCGARIGEAVISPLAPAASQLCLLSRWHASLHAPKQHLASVSEPNQTVTYSPVQKV